MRIAPYIMMLSGFFCVHVTLVFICRLYYMYMYVVVYVTHDVFHVFLIELFVFI